MKNNDKIKIVTNASGGYSISFSQLVGNYPTFEDARRMADAGGLVIENNEANVSEGKTAIEWFALLPDDIERMAIKNENSDPKKFDSLKDAILYSFPWGGSVQGAAFWRSVYESALLGEYK